MDKLVSHLSLSRIPHFTTLQKFADRVNRTIIQKIIHSFILLTRIRKLVLGIDSTGFRLESGSYYYVTRIKRYQWRCRSIGGYSIIPPREYDNVPIWRTMGKYRKQIKREG